MNKLHWSFVVFLSQGEVMVPEASLILEKGMSTFTVILDHVENFVESLTSRGVRIIRQSRLDEPPDPKETYALFAEQGESGPLVQDGTASPVSNEE